MAAKIISQEPLDNTDAKWLQLTKITYSDRSGRQRTWEAMRRPTRPSSSTVDGVQILAILERPSGSELLLEKQFRPPTGKIVIELPAGLVDPGETAEQAAIRELKEETGFVGEVLTKEKMVTWNSPASSSSCTYVIRMKIDLDKEENQDPKPQLEDGEDIECFSIPLKGLYAELRVLEQQGFAIDGKVAAFAEGLEVARGVGV